MLVQTKIRAALAICIASALLSQLSVTTVQAINGGAQLTFPWNWLVNAKYTGGPHAWAGNQHPGHPWNSLDFVPADRHVYAARAGYAYINDCGPGMVRIDHGDHYQTTYYHLTNVQITTNGTYVSRGAWLGDIGTTDPCHGGQATGDHVHFSVWYVPTGWSFSTTNDGEGVDLGGMTPTAAPISGPVQIGAWYWDDAGGQYCGGMTPVTGGARQIPDDPTDCLSSNTTYVFNDWLSEQVPIARRPGGQTEDLFLRGQSIQGYQVPTDANGNPTESWVPLGGLIKGSPTGVWNATTTELDVFVIGTGDNIFFKRWTSANGWEANWTSTTLVVGTTLTETVNSERIGDGVELFFEGSGGDAQMADLDSSLHVLGQPLSLGSPTSPNGIDGAPSGHWNSSGTRLDVFVIGSDNHPYRKSERCEFPPCVWDTAWTQLPGTAASAGTSSSGASAGVTEVVMSVRAPDDTIDLFYRGAANDAIHESLDQFGNFLRSESLGGVIKGAPDAKWDANKSRLDVFAIGTNDQIWQITWTQGSNPPWSGWRLLPGGGVWG